MRKFPNPGNFPQFSWITCEQNKFNYDTWSYEYSWLSGQPNGSDGDAVLMFSYSDTNAGFWGDNNPITADGSVAHTIFFLFIEFNQ
jgi:hypothetical protein